MWNLKSAPRPGPFGLSAHSARADWQPYLTPEAIDLLRRRWPLIVDGHVKSCLLKLEFLRNQSTANSHRGTQDAQDLCTLGPSLPQWRTKGPSFDNCSSASKSLQATTSRLSSTHRHPWWNVGKMLRAWVEKSIRGMATSGVSDTKTNEIPSRAVENESDADCCLWYGWSYSCSICSRRTKCERGLLSSVLTESSSTGHQEETSSASGWRHHSPWQRIVAHGKSSTRFDRQLRMGNTITPALLSLPQCMWLPLICFPPSRDQWEEWDLSPWKRLFRLPTVVSGKPSLQAPPVGFNSCQSDGIAWSRQQETTLKVFNKIGTFIILVFTLQISLGLQELTPPDFVNRLEFCRDILRCYQDDPNWHKRIVFSDEATLHLSGDINRHNSFYYSLENEHRIQENQMKGPGITVWAKIPFNGRIKYKIYKFS